MMQINLHWIDLAVLAAYLAMLVGIGLYFSRQQQKLEEFFLARRGITWLPVGLSLMAALNSGIDYVMQPAAVIKFGLVLLAGNLTWLVLYPYVFFITLPLFRRLNVYSAYEYLEHRFNLAVRGLGAGIFILWRLGWMATALYVPCLAISTATGRPDSLLPMIVGLGLLVTFYTMLGGIRAVIWTDVTQFCIMFLGLTGTLLICWWNVPGGFHEIIASAWQVGQASTPAVAESSGTVGELVREFFTTPVTAASMFFTLLIARLGTYTSDQVMIQRFQTTRSIRDARQGFLITAISDTVWMTALAAVGLALFAYFQHHPLPAVVQENPDNIFPYFLGEVFPIGLTGLAIAAILAASLSSIDSALNSLTSVVMIDFHQRMVLGRTRPDEVSDPQQQRRQVLMSRLVTVGLGIVGTALACNVSRLGTIFEIAQKLINSFTGPLLGVFLLGMFTRRANAAGAFVGGAAGTVVTLGVVHWSNVGGISFLWPSTFGLLTTLILGYAVSWVAGWGATPETAQRARWTFREIVSRPESEVHP
jgi:SSS family transporter